MANARDTRIDSLCEAYASIGGPAPHQWEYLRTVPDGTPVVLVNLFAFRTVAAYAEGEEQGTGEEAFQRYAAVSASALEAVGGRFVHVGGHAGNLVGADEAWDLVVVGEYPDVDALLALHEAADYQDAYRHRVAACERQQVLVSA